MSDRISTIAYTPDTAWTYSTARLWLEILPGAAVVLGGFLLMIATGRHIALFGALLAAAAGGWFALGTVLSPLWNNHVTMGGSPASSTQYMRIMEQLGFFTALGLVIVFIAAAALGRIASVTSGIRTIEPVTETGPAETVPIDKVPATTVPTRTVPASSAPASTGSADPLPIRTRADAGPAKPARTEDTTQTIG